MGFPIVRTRPEPGLLVFEERAAGLELGVVPHLRQRADRLVRHVDRVELDLELVAGVARRPGRDDAHDLVEPHAPFVVTGGCETGRQVLPPEERQQDA